MARLNNPIDNDSDGELPELAEILHGKPRESPKKGSRGGIKTFECCQRQTPESGSLPISSIKSAPRTTNNAFPKEGNTGLQECYKNLNVTLVDSLLLPLSSVSLSSAKDFHQDDDYNKRAQGLRFSPKRAARKPINYSIFSARPSDDTQSATEDDDSSTDLSGFIVPDSASEDEKKSWRPRRKESRKSAKIFNHRDQNPRQDHSGNTPKRGDTSKHSEVDLISPAKDPSDIELLRSPVQIGLPPKVQRPSTEVSELEEPFSQLRFSPPRSRKPFKRDRFDHLKTPPSSPSKSRLESPSKKHRIPPSPHRPSIDAFWSQDVINDWNDEYSPKKTCRVPGPAGLSILDEQEEDHDFSPVSPRKSPAKSPLKKDRQAVKAFNAEKSSFARSFLAEMDDKAANGQVSNLAASTGGINIIWSKKLSSTAGRANWRREAIRHKKADDTYSESTFRHHASIELAEKVIDSKDRLINVLAHEYCHLANFMISGVKDQPHGKEFKAWAAKVTREFRHRGVEVTTKHGYDITYKYIWSCEKCRVEYKRHSKSIDPSKHRCGSCKGRLLQILPAPRKESEYQKFVKANWDRFKRMAGDRAGMGEINALLAKEWDLRKAGERAEREDVEVAEVVDGPGENAGREESVGIDACTVARKLDFLSLGNKACL